MEDIMLYAYHDTLIFIILSYLCGSISSAILTCKMMGLPDPRTQGSGNPGTTNVLRFGGKKATIMTLIGDILKGVIPVVIAESYNIGTLGLGFIALAAFIGHLYPVFFKFQGGKGVATALGCLTALSWPMGLALLITWITVAFVTRYSSLAALLAAVLAPYYAAYFTKNPAIILVSCIMSMMLIWRHRKNISKLLARQEKKIGAK
jgi:glycerol-3-phosphate acyltransferase PlsY